jgi:predicted XRE-type DNA-binding protein
MPAGSSQREAKAQIQESSGNVFEDLGLPNSAQALARAELAGQIVALISERGLTQTAAARLLGIDQPGISDLVRGKLKRFSIERLFRFLVALGQDVEIRVRPTRRATSSIRFVADRRPRQATGKGGTKVIAKRSRKGS